MDPSIDKFSTDFFRLDGKAAIITGGNTNLGTAYTVALARAGADIFIPHFEEDVSDVKAAVEKTGRRIEFLRGDLTDPVYRKSVTEKCLETYGRADILVNNAGISIHGELDTYPDETYQKMIEVDLNVSYYLCREVGLKMKDLGNGGKIINIGSALSFTGAGAGMPYPIAKHGIIGLTRSMAAAFLNDDIQVNAICPGFFHSPVNKGVPPEAVQNIARRCKGGTWGEYGDLMGTAVFLASRASDYVTGTYIIVDGGFAANYF
jgi:2-deoxy-D-gluconate 3-dehydrogenase